MGGFDLYFVFIKKKNYKQQTKDQNPFQFAQYICIKSAIVFV